MRTTFDLTGKTALVTGASRGIGKATALELIRAGASVLFHGSRDSEALRQAVAEAGENATAVTVDLSDSAAVEAFADKLPVLDIFVVNASIQSYTSVELYSTPEFQKEMQVNVGAVFQLMRHIAPGMCERKNGRIIAVSSINQRRPAARLAVYSATKGALANLMNGAAKLYAPFGVTVNTIQPGVIVTDRNRDKLKDQDFANALMADIPAHRFGTAEECAHLIRFLASDEAAYITGAEIPIAGGWHL